MKFSELVSSDGRDASWTLPAPASIPNVWLLLNEIGPPTTMKPPASSLTMVLSCAEALPGWVTPSSP